MGVFHEGPHNKDYSILGSILGSHSKDHSILGSILGSPYSGKLPYSFDC